MRSNNRPRREVAVLLIAFIVCAAVLGALMLMKYEERRLQPVAPPQSQQEGVFLVTLFFASPEGAGLVREGREIDACDGPSECVEAVVEELINGPLGDLAPTLPVAATIHDVQVDGDLALVDFGEELAEGLPGGSNAEMTACSRPARRSGTAPRRGSGGAAPGCATPARAACARFWSGEEALDFCHGATEARRKTFF